MDSIGKGCPIVEGGATAFQRRRNASALDQLSWGSISSALCASQRTVCEVSKTSLPHSLAQRAPSTLTHGPIGRPTCAADVHRAGIASDGRKREGPAGIQMDGKCVGVMQAKDWLGSIAWPPQGGMTHNQPPIVMTGMAVIWYMSSKPLLEPVDHEATNCSQQTAAQQQPA